MCSFHGLGFFWLGIVVCVGNDWFGCVKEKRVVAGFFDRCCSSRWDSALIRGEVGGEHRWFCGACWMPKHINSFVQSLWFLSGGSSAWQSFRVGQLGLVNGDAVEVYPWWASFKPAQATETGPSQVQILPARPLLEGFIFFGGVGLSLGFFGCYVFSAGSACGRLENKRIEVDLAICGTPIKSSIMSSPRESRANAPICPAIPDPSSNVKIATIPNS